MARGHFQSWSHGSRYRSSLGTMIFQGPHTHQEHATWKPQQTRLLANRSLRLEREKRTRKTGDWESERTSGREGNDQRNENLRGKEKVVKNGRHWTWLLLATCKQLLCRYRIIYRRCVAAPQANGSISSPLYPYRWSDEASRKLGTRMCVRDMYVYLLKYLRTRERIM